MTEKKEMTAHTPSVGADGEQSPISNTTTNITDFGEDFNENFEETVDFEEMMNPNYMHTATMSELFETSYQPRLHIVKNFLYPGVYLFAGAPKVGKSFFVAQLGYHVSTGKELWGRDVRQGEVLYLALEDDFSRLQYRLSTMFGVEGTKHFHLSTMAKSIGEGLTGQLERFLKKHPGTKLVIIDTLQKVRENAGENMSYASDYQIIGQLKEFADSKGISILIVHHTRKQKSDNAFAMISGTSGLYGAADGAFVLRRSKRENKGMLHVIGRDAPEQNLKIHFNPAQCVWEFEGEDTEVHENPPDELLEKVAELMETTSPWKGTASELVEILKSDIHPRLITRRLNVNTNRLLSEFGIRYSFGRNHGGRFIVMEKQP